MIETRNNSKETVVFQLAELVSLYHQRLQQFGMQAPDAHATRLKERLMAELPDLEAHKSGRDILLAFRKDIGPVLTEVLSYSDALILAKAAKILRQHMVSHKCNFDGAFDENSLTHSVPPSLLQFVCMVEHGADIKSQLRFSATTTDLAMSQLLQCNCFAKKNEGSTAPQRHSRDHETPFPIFLGCLCMPRQERSSLLSLCMSMILAFRMTECLKSLLNLVMM